jgi:LacI family transcriptional regulator
VPTIADVARHAGVSPMTVSRVINNETNVRSSTRETVTTSINELGYSPNQAARSLAGADQIHIGMLFDNPRTTYVSAFLIGGLQQTSLRHVQLTVKQTENPGDATTAIRAFSANGVDGVVLPAPISDWVPVLDLIEELDMPTVLVATGRPYSACSAVGIDDFLAAHAMVDHLLSLGHRRIGFITGDPDQLASQRRLQGYRDAIATAGLEVDEELVGQGLFTYRSGLGAAEKLLALDDPPTAIFASNDEMAAATVALAHRNGLDVPGDLSVCGFDDTALARTVWPALTTVHQPIEEMSRTAVDHLVSIIQARRKDQRAERRHIVLDFTLVQRESDAPPPD